MKEFIITVVFLFISLLISLFLIYVEKEHDKSLYDKGYKEGYKAACRDSYKGVLKIELGNKEWRWVEGGK